MVLLDVILPGLDGYEICKILKADSIKSKIPIIFITAMTKRCHENVCFSIGGDDYMRKHIEPEIVRRKVRRQIERTKDRSRLEYFQRFLAQVHAESAVLEQIIVILMVSMTFETNNHVARIKKLFSLLAGSVSVCYPEMVDHYDVDIMARAAVFHDIGKAGLPTDLLWKCEPVNEEDFKVLQRHTTNGSTILRSLHPSPEASAFLAFACEIAEYHHERWDGSGYPFGIIGEEIPVSACIMALVDEYDFLTSSRALQRGQSPLPHEKAVTVIKNGDENITSLQFDPKIVEAFLKVENSFANAWRKGS
ncbi:MAG: HD domain-containing protein [Desulfobulbus sp.]|nr:HD domain-containing protein [Desulfobulbus sp.]